jgi:hypothetical protein
MKLLAALFALVLAGCQTTVPDVGGAYGQYAIALQNAADYAESAQSTGTMANVVGAMADFNESPEMTGAIDHAEAYLICTAPVPHDIPDYDCEAFDLSPTAMKPVVEQLQYGSFVLRQGTFAIKDMHGLPTTIGEEHDDDH